MKPYLTCVHFQNSNNSWPVFSPKSSIKLLSKVNTILVSKKKTQDFIINVNIDQPFTYPCPRSTLYTISFILMFEGPFLIFLSWLSRSEEQKTAPRKPAPTNNGDPGHYKYSQHRHSGRGCDCHYHCQCNLCSAVQHL